MPFKKILSAFLITFFSLPLFSQEAMESFTVKSDKKTDVFQIVEQNKNQVALFFSNKKKVTAVRLDNTLKVIDSVHVDRPSKDYDDIIGYSVSTNVYNTFWSDSKCKEILVQTFDFNTKKVDSKALSLSFDNEKVFKKITVNGHFYILSVTRSSNIINVYKFENATFSKKVIDLSGKRFFGLSNQFSNLHSIIAENSVNDPAYKVESMLTETTPSLILSASKRKIYAFDNQLVLTFDNSKNYTQAIYIDLNNFTSSCKLYPQAKFDEAFSNESNSFLFDNKIIQMRLDSDKMLLTVKDKEGEELKSFVINDDQEIPFKNSEIIQENGNVNNIRILDRSNQLLRKINYLYPSLSCYTFNDVVYLTIGGVSPVQNNSTIMYGGMVGGLTGALIGAALSSNYSMNNLNSYNNRKVVYINCLFDKNFNHIEGVSKKIAFDQLRVFADKNQNLENKTLFKLNNVLYFGGHDKENQKYLFHKFVD